MIELPVGITVFAICMAGCALTSFHLGRREGIESTVQYLIDQGVLELDDDLQATNPPKVVQSYRASKEPQRTERTQFIKGETL